MKLGLVLALAAVFMFSATIIWSAQKSVVRPWQNENIKFAKSSTLGRRGPSLYFYPAEKVRSVNIQVPVDVELDEGFTGVELHGDTSMFKHLDVSTSYGHLNVGYRWLGPQSIPLDSIAEMIKKTSVTIKVGIGPVASGDYLKRRFSFAGCKKVSAATPIHGSILSLQLQSPDSVQLSLDVKTIEIYCYGGRSGIPRSVLQFSGTVNQLLISQMIDTHLAATGLLSKEVYIRQAKNSILDVYASEIANIQNKDTTCTLHLSGDPRYTRMTEK